MIACGHRVLGTDFSESVIAENQARYSKVAGLTFQTMTIAAPLPLADNEFDVIYAHLSLHYLPDLETQHVFRELQRVLRPGGILAFLCKSIGDPLYGKGSTIEPDMFDLNGHVRHFFSEEYARGLMKGLFDIAELSLGEADFYQHPSAFVSVIASNM
jgi:SAM-dependent methyltransferase